MYKPLSAEQENEFLQAYFNTVSTIIETVIERRDIQVEIMKSGDLPVEIINDWKAFGEQSALYHISHAYYIEKGIHDMKQFTKEK